MFWIFVLSLATLLLLAFWTNRQRAKQKINFELKNNLLMTKHPLLFINPRRSLFYWIYPWNQIPSYLTAHGYETFEKNLPPTSSPKARAQALLNNLHELSQESLRFHLFFEHSQAEVLTEILNSKVPESISSITYVAPQEFEWTGLKSPPIPVHSIPLPAEKAPAFYALHLWLTQQTKKAPAPLGLRTNPEDYNSLLHHIQTLAEKDFLESSSNV
ncbi:MAG: hypothetical protein LW875_10395 [Proteobacteria bacterium]|jgi:hypothetical protein|nr:hypothetical protein [Pseudomonadota bacterium]